MAIDLSTLTLTNEAEMILLLGIVKMVRFGNANTLSGNDTITSSATTSDDSAGIENNGSIDIGTGGDKMTATGRQRGITNGSNTTINTGEGIESGNNLRLKLLLLTVCF
ncbi:hypothetical protein [Chamaesiphon sp. VAR_48_metabat_135_sub]|uniref:hypothetical protein n=1 Tax=Chamaesiphon sp. VAR_48_metabat_135_sub TaxID=2964699 RepID=UPI00286BA254|nr:hypothetical protein [Chamaesiphon sp. VAR_48_metabat_135_sub]